MMMIAKMAPKAISDTFARRCCARGVSSGSTHSGELNL
jgi:hypothetical protein